MRFLNALLHLNDRYSTPVPRVLDQATFVPGSVWMNIHEDGTPHDAKWPSSSTSALPAAASLRHRAVALVPSVLVNGRWFSATAGEADPHGRIRGWRIWPLGEWAGPPQSLSRQEWHRLGFDATPSPPALPFFTDLPLDESASHGGPRIAGARIRLVVGEPWAATHPVIDVDPLRPWADVFEHWRTVLLLLGFADEQARQSETVRLSIPDLRVRGPWPTESRDAGGGVDENAGIPGWSLRGEWEPTSMIQPFAGQRPRIPAVWCLYRDGSYRSWMPPRSDAPPEGSLPFSSDLVSAARMCLQLHRRGHRAVLAEAGTPSSYTAFRHRDPTLIDPKDPTTAEALSRAEMRSWGIRSHGREGAISGEVERASVHRVEALAIGVGPSLGRTSSVPLPQGADLSELFSHPDLVRSALGELAQP